LFSKLPDDYYELKSDLILVISEMDGVSIR
jgi:hypothetical protein